MFIDPIVVDIMPAPQRLSVHELKQSSLVVGVSGVTGTPLAEELLQLRDWKVYGVSRRYPELRADASRQNLVHVAVYKPSTIAETPPCWHQKSHHDR